MVPFRGYGRLTRSTSLALLTTVAILAAEWADLLPDNVMLAVRAGCQVYVLLRVMRAPGADEKRRDAMATAAATYIHPKLSSVDLKADVNVANDTSELTRAQLLDIARAGSKGTPAAGDGAREPDRVHKVH